MSGDFISAQERRRIERSNTWHDIWQQDADHAAQMRRKHEMSKLKTPQGSVKRFPSVSDTDDIVTELWSEMAALFDEAQAERKRREGMSAKPVDGSRFPASRTGQ